MYWLEQDIEVPETILKKRKQNEKAREERLAAATAARKVCVSLVDSGIASGYSVMMHTLYFMASQEFVSTMLPEINHLSGLNFLSHHTRQPSDYSPICFLGGKGQAQGYLQAC